MGILTLVDLQDEILSLTEEMASLKRVFSVLERDDDWSTVTSLQEPAAIPSVNDAAVKADPSPPLSPITTPSNTFLNSTSTIIMVALLLFLSLIISIVSSDSYMDAMEYLDIRYDAK